MSTLSANRGLLGASAVVFVASAITTVLWCGSMASMPGMPWMRMPGQTWLGGAATFIGMWIVMMVAMMLPALVPMLMRYRTTVAGTAGIRLAWLTVIVGAAYFAVWTLCGVVVFPLGLALAEAAIRVPAISRAMPLATGVVVVVAGFLQFTALKKRQLACCRAMPACAANADAVTAWRNGLRLGLHCLRCCAGFTAVLLVIGVMDLRAMAVVAALITAERLAPTGLSVARGAGIVIISSGILLLAQEMIFLI